MRRTLCVLVVALCVASVMAQNDGDSDLRSEDTPSGSVSGASENSEHQFDSFEQVMRDTAKPILEEHARERELAQEELRTANAEVDAAVKKLQKLEADAALAVQKDKESQSKDYEFKAASLNADLEKQRASLARAEFQVEDLRQQLSRFKHGTAAGFKILLATIAQRKARAAKKAREARRSAFALFRKYMQQKRFRRAKQQLQTLVVNGYLTSVRAKLMKQHIRGAQKKHQAGVKKLRQQVRKAAARKRRRKMTRKLNTLRRALDKRANRIQQYANTISDKYNQQGKLFLMEYLNYRKEWKSQMSMPNRGFLLRQMHKMSKRMTQVMADLSRARQKMAANRARDLANEKKFQATAQLSQTALHAVQEARHHILAVMENEIDRKTPQQLAEEAAAKKQSAAERKCASLSQKVSQLERVVKGLEQQLNDLPTEESTLGQAELTLRLKNKRVKLAQWKIRASSCNVKVEVKKPAPVSKDSELQRLEKLRRAGDTEEDPQ